MSSPTDEPNMDDMEIPEIELIIRVSGCPGVKSVHAEEVRGNLLIPIPSLVSSTTDSLIHRLQTLSSSVSVSPVTHVVVSIQPTHAFLFSHFVTLFCATTVWTRRLPVTVTLYGFVSGVNDRWSTERSMSLLSGVFHGPVPFGRVEDDFVKGEQVEDAMRAARSEEREAQGQEFGHISHL